MPFTSPDSKNNIVFFVQVVFEREEEEQKFPVIMIHSALEGLVCDWSQLPYMKGLVPMPATS